MKVSDFMITDVISVTGDTTLKELLKKLVNNKIGGVPVIDEENHLIGMISDGDVLRYIQPKGTTIFDAISLVMVSEKEDFTEKLAYTLDHEVSTIMRKRDLKFVYADEPLERSLRIFSKHHFKKNSRHGSG
ncbi:CBS domain-containing protein [Virgibacillus halophilus]|uniref:CBS domain-containing protein n=1 Tax=Tigheibacillus halophilus TaxID=361280 RepID=A0ABU5CBH6_9BACI|nr:CBS domain-containing protein [Virgibacillus halophilus]